MRNNCRKKQKQKPKLLYRTAKNRRETAAETETKAEAIVGRKKIYEDCRNRDKAEAIAGQQRRDVKQLQK
jgi:hypothetical protein